MEPSGGDPGDLGDAGEANACFCRHFADYSLFSQDLRLSSSCSCSYSFPEVSVLRKNAKKD